MPDLSNSSIMTVTFAGDGMAVAEQRSAFERLCNDNNITWRCGRASLIGRGSITMKCDYIFPNGQDLLTIRGFRAAVCGPAV